MFHLVVKGPDDEAEHAIELDEGEMVLLGRSPEESCLERPPECLRHALRMVPVPHATVSANHALVWINNAQMCVKDLNSRNGSTVSLPRGRILRIERESGLQLRLAEGADATTPSDEPATPKWSSERDFGAAVRTSIENWLKRLHVDAHVALVLRSVPVADLPGRLPLATGEALEVIPHQTVDMMWSQQLELLWRWVTRVNLIYESELETRSEGMILASLAIRQAHREVMEAARSKVPTLLLTGPSGSGKEQMAEAFHRNSGRNGPFVVVNCAMFNKELLRSELFGAEAGSFTGAVRRITGAVERAHGGTLFLDEIGELDADVQPMLLRFLDKYEYERLGQYGRGQRADVRLVGATNRDLRQAVRSGRFREDLWYRLSVHVVEVPPLKARWDDVMAFLERTQLDDGRSIASALAPAARDLLRAHAWEGNFRELINFSQRILRSPPPAVFDEAACRTALEKGALNPIVETVPPIHDGHRQDWAELTARAVHAFCEDRGHEPRTWDDQKEYSEKYLKPLLFFHMCGAAGQPPPGDENALGALASRAASHVGADRGTALKQLARYFERLNR